MAVALGEHVGDGFGPHDDTRASPLFEVRAEVLQTLLDRGQRHAYSADTTVFGPDERPGKLFYLHQGLVRQHIVSARGVEKAIGLLRPGSFFGEALLLNECASQTSAVVVSDSVIYSFTRATMDELFRDHPELMLEVARSLSFKVQLLTSQIWIMASEESETKVGKVLYLLSRDRRERRPALYLTHQELADLAGVHRVTASTVLTGLTKEGVIECHRGRVLVKRRDRLLRYRLE